MTTLIRTISFSFLAFLLLACEGMSHAEGIVLSSDTKVPIDNVELKFSEDRQTMVVTDTIYTDSLGRFQIGHLTMCTFKCPNYTLTFSKKGYSPTTLFFAEQILDTTLTVLLSPTK
jgi:hypothetical protein